MEQASFLLPESPLVDEPTYLPFTQGQSLFDQGNLQCTINSRGNKIIRETCVGDAVSCYRNLNKPTMFSVMQSKGENKGKVSGYAPVIVLKGTPENPLSVKVSEASRQRILIKKVKNVHAKLMGVVCDAYSQPLTLKALNQLDCLTYNPYQGPNFYRVSDGKTFTGDLPYEYAIVCGSSVYCC
jgi:hypothetical protein